MKNRTVLSLMLALGLLLAGGSVWCQEPPVADVAADEDIPPLEPVLKYGEYTVKAYTLTFFGGSFSGASYLENKELGDRTILTDGAGDILGYDGNVLYESTLRYEGSNRLVYDGAHKEIEAGTAFGAKLGIYISENFHLDLIGTYAKGDAVTTMRFLDEEDNPDDDVRLEVDRDPDFQALKGGLALSYDAEPATLYGIMPRLGFGLGGVINRFSQLEDKTALYLEGNFGLSIDLMKNVSLDASADVCVFAFDVDELGYTNMVNYKYFTVGLTWFMDVLPSGVRAAHEADQRR